MKKWLPMKMRVTLLFIALSLAHQAFTSLVQCSSQRSLVNEQIIERIWTSKFMQNQARMAKQAIKQSTLLAGEQKVISCHMPFFTEVQKSMGISADDVVPTYAINSSLQTNSFSQTLAACGSGYFEVDDAYFSSCSYGRQRFIALHESVHYLRNDWYVGGIFKQGSQAPVIQQARLCLAGGITATLYGVPAFFALRSARRGYLLPVLLFCGALAGAKLVDYVACKQLDRCLPQAQEWYRQYIERNADTQALKALGCYQCAREAQHVDAPCEKGYLRNEEFAHYIAQYEQRKQLCAYHFNRHS